MTVTEMMSHWNNGAPSLMFPGETTLSCPKCASTAVVMRCNSFYGAATPWESVTCSECGHGERVNTLPFDLRERQLVGVGRYSSGEVVL